MGKEESCSPFLNIQAKKISKNLPLKTAILAALFLVIALCLSWVPDSPLWILPISLVYLLVGTPALIAATEDLFRVQVNIDVLTTLAAFGALLIGGPLEGGLLLVLFALSGALGDLVTLRAKSTLSAIHELMPEKAYVVEQDGQYVERAIKDVSVGTLIIVRAGELVPLDGSIVKGTSSVSTAHLTGESVPITVKDGDTIISGTRVLDGALEVKVACTSYNSTVAKLVRLITEAHSAKPQIARTFERFGRLYALTVIAVTVLLSLVLPFVFNMSFLGGDGSLFRAMTFMITASPCALVLAVPITYLSALGAAAREGAILKGSSVFDGLVQCSLVAFDKTGTLTEGVLSLDEVVPLSEKRRSSPEIIGIAAALEHCAVHPTAHAIVKAFSQFQAPQLEATEVRVIAGVGVEGIVAGVRVFIGKPDEAFSRLDIDIGKATKQVDSARSRGCATAVLSIGRDEAYLCTFFDSIRSDSKETISGLKNRGKRVLMLTGDGKKPANDVGNALGIDEVYAELTPEAKLDFVTHLSEKGLIMVGDGINDAPSLARATVGVSMGQLSSASAREASDVVLLHNALPVLVWLMEKAAKTQRIMTQNLTVATLAILVGTAASALALLPLWLAVSVHEGSTLIVGLNALRLLHR